MAHFLALYGSAALILILFTGIVAFFSTFTD